MTNRCSIFILITSHPTSKKQNRSLLGVLVRFVLEATSSVKNMHALMHTQNTLLCVIPTVPNILTYTITFYLTYMLTVSLTCVLLHYENLLGILSDIVSDKLTSILKFHVTCYLAFLPDIYFVISDDVLSQIFLT